MSLSLLRPLGAAALVFPFFSGCWWARNPGPAAFDAAQGPVSLVSQRAAGPATYLTVAVRAGSAHDPVGKEGLAALTAQLLRQGGAGALTPEGVDERLYGLGTDISVVVDKELVTFRTRALHEDLGPVAELVADLLLHPRLDPVAFGRIKGEATDWLTRGILGSDEALGAELFDTWLYEGHPYGHPVEGRAGVLPTLTLDDVRAFLDERYLRVSTTLGVAGPCVEVDGGPLRAAEPGGAAAIALRDQLSTLPDRLYRDVTPRVVPPLEGRSLIVVEKPTASTGVHFGHPLEINRGHPDWPALLLAFTALGEHRQGHGRLYQGLREARGLNYGDYAYIERYRQAGWSSIQETGTGRLQNPFSVWIRPVASGNGPFAIKGALTLLQAFVDQGLGEEEFLRIQKYLSARLALWAEEPERRLGWAVEASAMGWPDPITTLPAAVAALQQEQVNAAIRTWIHPEALRFVVVTGDGAAFQAAMQGAAPTPPVPVAGAPAPEAAIAAENARWSELQVGLREARVITTEDLFR